MKINWPEIDWEIWAWVAFLIVLIAIVAFVAHSCARIAPVA